MQTLDEYAWVFVGCGGTFYAASPYLAVLVHRHFKDTSVGDIILVDPDGLDVDNYSRQWPGYDLGEAKVECAERALALEDDYCGSLRLVCRFQEAGPMLDEYTNGRPVLAIVNVDNDQTRLDVASWLEKRISPGIMVVSGCEGTHGQAYPGVWMDGQAVYDWRKIHADVGEESTGPVNPCQAQTIQANALTGVLVGMCIEDIAQRLRGGILNFVREFYWEMRPSGRHLSMWSNLEMCEKAVTL